MRRHEHARRNAPRNLQQPIDFDRHIVAGYVARATDKAFFPSMTRHGIQRRKARPGRIEG
jgi:hypothetical protein